MWTAIPSATLLGCASSNAATIRRPCRCRFAAPTAQTASAHDGWQRLLARLLRGVRPQRPRQGHRRPWPSTMPAGVPAAACPDPARHATAGPKRSSDRRRVCQRRCRPGTGPSSAYRGPIGDWGAAHHRTRGQRILPLRIAVRAHRDGRRTLDAVSAGSPFRPAAFGLPGRTPSARPRCRRHRRGDLRAGGERQFFTPVLAFGAATGTITQHQAWDRSTASPSRRHRSRTVVWFWRSETNPHPTAPQTPNVTPIGSSP